MSSVSTRLQELLGRITEIADGLGADEREDMAAELYEVERTLRAAARRLSRVVDR